MGFAELSKKSESYEICFVPDNDYRAFLRNKVDNLDEKVSGGNFISTDGKILGTHKGYPFYTIGQRKGLDIALGEPAYVAEIIPETNTVVLGNLESLQKQEMWVRNINLVKYANLPESIEVVTKIRYKDRGTISTVSMHDNLVRVLFHQPVSGVAPGHSAVFYDGDDVVGGGFIEKGGGRN